MDRTRTMRLWRNQQGLNLLETAVALALVALLVVPLAAGLGFIIVHSDRVSDRSTLLLLAKSQLEDTLSQPYQPSGTASYSVIEGVPTEYSIAITVTKPVTYVYAAPSSAEAPETVQRITVTVNGLYGSFELEGFKAKR